MPLRVRQFIHYWKVLLIAAVGFILFFLLSFILDAHDVGDAAAAAPLMITGLMATLSIAFEGDYGHVDELRYRCGMYALAILPLLFVVVAGGFCPKIVSGVWGIWLILALARVLFTAIALPLMIFLTGSQLHTPVVAPLTALQTLERVSRKGKFFLRRGREKGR